MDMKKFLQAVDGVSLKKPVEGSNHMAKFLRVVKEADLNQPPAAPAAPGAAPQAKPAAPKFYITQTNYDSLDEPPDFSVTDLQRGIVVKSFETEKEARAFVAQQDPAGAAQTELLQFQSKATPPEANPDAAPQQPVAESLEIAKLVKLVEGKGPLNRLTTAEAIAVQTYTAPEPRKTITSPVLNVEVGAKPGMIGKYFKAVEEEIAESQERSKDRARQLAEIVASKMNEGVPRLSKHIAQSKIPPDAVNRRAKNFAQKRLKYSEETEGVDSVTLDIPLLIRLMEFAREDAADDMVLHKIAERLIGMGEEGQSLSMSDYDNIVGDYNQDTP